MLRHIMAKSTLVALACTLSISAHAIADAPSQVNVPAGELIAALKSLAAQADIELVYQPEQLRNLQTRGLQGSYSPHDAVAQLLKGTPFEVRTDSSGAMVIALPVSPASPTSNNTKRSESTQSKPTAVDAERKEGRTPSFWDRFRLSQAPAGASAAVSESEQPPAQSGRIEEIVVTAQKRLERLLDVPVPVTSISGDTLGAQNALRLQDYYARIPGFTVTPGIQSAQILSIRGISTGYGTNPTVGVTVDDVPYGATANRGGGNVVPDIDPSDLARVEVLRGPQGTLYGASSMGGLLKFVTVDPSTAELSGRVQAGLSSVKNGDEPGYNVRGSVNVPLSDAFAIRASAFTRRDPGYIDDPVHQLEGVNSLDVHGGLLSALWKPSDAFSLKLAALFQKSTADGAPSADPALGDLNQNRIGGTGWVDRKTRGFSATLDAKLGMAELTSITGYSINEFSDSLDAGFVYAGLMQSAFGVTGAELANSNETRKLTQELRLSMPLGDKLQWLFGAFYTDDDSEWLQNIRGIDPVTAARVGTLRANVFPTTYNEYAAFTDFTWQVTERFDVQMGGRQSWLREHDTITAYGLGGTSGVGAVTDGRARSEAFTYLLTPRFRISPNLMTYARLASGYRAGGVNQTPSPGDPLQYDPDETQNYELGIKADVLNHMLSFDASLYRIDWRDIQLIVINSSTGRSFTTNGGRARSQGLELAATLEPTGGLRISTSMALTDAKLVEDLPTAATVRGRDGDRLPNTARFSGSLAVDQQFPLGAHVLGNVGVTLSYVGDRRSVFTGGVGARQEFPSYTKLDFSAGVEYGDWTADLALTNLTDKRGVLYGGIGALPPFAYIYIQPRTAALSISRRF